MDRSRLIAQLRSVPVRRRIITALDVPSGREAVSLAASMGRGDHFVKVGLELFSAAGPEVVQKLQAIRRRVFLDLKYHDIPNTVAGGRAGGRRPGRGHCARCTPRRGAAALSAAAEALAGLNGPGQRPALLAVTVLTSLSEPELAEACPSPDALADRIDRLARLAWDCGCDGLVCSAADLPRLRAAVGPEPLVVTPGIRPAGSAVDDQLRIATPLAALQAGADFLVIGRPITRAANPAAALAAIADELAQTGGSRS